MDCHFVLPMPFKMTVGIIDQHRAGLDKHVHDDTEHFSVCPKCRLLSNVEPFIYVVCIAG